MIYLYDKALENKLKKVFPRVIYAPVDKFFDRYLIGTSEQNDQSTTTPIQLPSLSLFRSEVDFDNFNSISPLTIANRSYKNVPKMISQSLTSLITPIKYQLEIWAKSDVDRDDMLREVLYFFTMYPNICIEYNERCYAFPVYVRGVQDNSDISSFSDTGSLYRYTLDLEIPDGRMLFTEDVKLFKYIKCVVEVEDDNKKGSEVKS